MWWCALALAQAPASDWKTVRTEHFRVHYPEEAAPWAEAATGRIEALHARVVEEVGYSSPRVIDVVIRDPYATANGMALPFLGAPRLELWTSPPEATSVIGNRRSWDELLLVHEDTHLAHLLRPSRDPLAGAVDRLLGWGPVARKAPAWVAEGYATLIEGRLTGSGRPNAGFRWGLLKALARDGRLPSYGELDWNDRYLGGSYRYLVGSAFLAWLETDVGPRVGASDHALRDLWMRMTARKTRSFDEAFRGVFRDSPAVLYGQFRAAVQGAASLEPRGEDHVFFEHAWGTSRPTVSPDGTRIAAVVEDRRRPAALVVWDTAFDREAEEKWEERADKIAARDPEDVRSVRPWAFPPREIDRLTRRIGAPNAPVFEPGGTLLYTAWTRDETGRVRSDIYRWTPGKTPGRSGVQRVTRGADLRAADPAPDGSWAVAVRSRWGQTEIVRIDLVSGGITPIAAEQGVDFDGPRVAPDGRVAWLENRGSGWTPVVDGTALPVHGVSDLAWGPGGDLLGVCAGSDGLDACRLAPDPAALTRHGAVLGIDVRADGRLYFAALDADGVDLRTFQQKPRAWQMRAAVTGPPPVTPVVVEARRYGAGPLDVTPLFGGAFSGPASTSEYGLRLGDPVGRWEALTLGAVGTASGVSGGGVQGAWRGIRPEVLASAWVTAGSAPLGPTWTAGGWAGLRGESSATAAALGAEIGIAAEQRLDDGGRAVFGTAEFAWGALEPRRAALGSTGSVHAQGGGAGGSFALLAGDATVSLGRAWGIDLGYGAGITAGSRLFSLGGVETGVVPAADRWSILVAPAFPAALATGRLRDRVEFAVVTPWAAVFAERWRVADTLGPHGATVAGLRIDGSFPRQPLARFAAFASAFGVGIRLEDPDAGWLDRPPTWEDLAGWGSLRWLL